MRSTSVSVLVLPENCEPVLDVVLSGAVAGPPMTVERGDWMRAERGVH